MSGYSGFLFDFDFTLVTALPGITESYNAAFRAFGYPGKDEETVKKTVGLPVPTSFMLMEPSLDEKKALELTAVFDKAADRYMTPNTSFLPGSREMVTDIVSSGGKVGVVSTKKGYRIREFFAVNHMEDLLSVVIGGADVKKMKPDPEGILLAVSDFSVSFGIPKEKVLYIGDNPVDGQAALAAGVDFAAVVTGSSSRGELSRFPHVFLCEDMHELHSLLFSREK